MKRHNERFMSNASPHKLIAIYIYTVPNCPCNSMARPFLYDTIRPKSVVMVARNKSNLEFQRVAASFGIGHHQIAPLSQIADSFTNDSTDDSGTQLLFLLYLLDISQQRKPQLLAGFITQLGDDIGRALEWMPRDVCADLIARSKWAVGELKLFFNQLYGHKSMNDMHFFISVLDPAMLNRLASSALASTHTEASDISFLLFLSELSRFQLRYHFDENEKYIIADALLDEPEMPDYCCVCEGSFEDAMYVKRLFYDPQTKEACHEECRVK